MILYFIFTFYSFLFSPEPIVIDFTNEDVSDSWIIINDGVMGGLSKGKIVSTESGIRFEGTVSLENNGGFTSMRSPSMDLDLTGYSTISIKYRSSGVLNAFQMERYPQFYRPNFKVPLKNASEWNIIRVSLMEISQYQMGKKMNRSKTEDDLAKIIRIGFITNEKKGGDFSLEIEEIRFE